MEQKEEKESVVYHIQMLDNGIVISQPDYEILECEKFSDKGNCDDKNMKDSFGKYFWEDIYQAMNSLLSNNIKITLTIEEDK